MITVKVSSRGQIAIPKNIREQVGFDTGTELAIEVKGQDMIIKKVLMSSWRRWRGFLKGTDTLQEHEREHQEELKKDAEGS